MAFAFIPGASVIKQGTSAGSGNSAAIDTTGANLIVISIGGVGGVVSDSKSNTWTALTVHGNNKLYYCYNPVVGAGHTFASNAASSFSCVAAAAFSGAASSPLDQQNGATGGSSTTSLATGSVTPTDANQLLVMGLGDFAPNGGSTAISVGTVLQSANINGGVSYGNAIAYEIQTTATTRNPSWSWLTGTGGSTAASIATFKAAAGGAGVTGTIASTEANDVLAATGSVQTVGTIATIEAADILAASGFLGFTGTIATTEANDALAATGKVLITGTAPLVESADVLAATGTVSQPARTGTIALVEAGDTFAATGPPAVGVQVLNYGVWRRRREEYEAKRREEESLEEIARELAADLDEGLPEPPQPEPASPGAEALDAASLALSRASAALTIDETVAARIAAAVEAKVRSAAPRIVAQASVAAIVTALSDYDDDEEAVLALLFAA